MAAWYEGGETGTVYTEDVVVLDEDVVTASVCQLDTAFVGDVADAGTGIKKDYLFLHDEETGNLYH